MQNLGICKVASGELYAKEYPTIFPNVQLCLINGEVELNLEPTITIIQRAENVKNNILNSTSEWVHKHPYVTAVGTITGCILAASDWYWIPAVFVVAAPVFALYKQLGYKTMPSNHVYRPIRCSQKDDGFIKNILSKSNPEKISLIEDLDIAFRNYRLGVINASQLEFKIKALIEKKKKQDSKSYFSTLSEMEHLFKAGEDARNEIGDKNLVVVLGPTGSGKTTACNYLCNCKMKEVEPNFFRQPGKHKKLIIAENCLGDIGHKTGENSSETFDPQLFVDQENEITYCDCPGIGDTRKKSVSFCNSLSMVEILKNAKTIQGLIFFINDEDKGERKASIEKYMKILQLLLEDFEPYKNSILFVISKAKKKSLPALQNSFKKCLESIIDNDDSNDPELKNFCASVVKSNVWKESMITCDPLSNEQGRKSMIHKIKELIPLDPKGCEFGYPVTPEDRLVLVEIKNEISNEIKQTLIKLKQSIHSLWNDKEDKTIVHLKSLFVLFSKMDSGTLSPEEIISNGYYSQFDHLINSLRNGKEFWEKVNQLSPKPEKIDLNDMFKNECQEIAEELKLLKYQCFKNSFRIALESYEIQKNINLRRIYLNKLGNSPDEIITIIQYVMKEANIEIFYESHLATVIKEMNKNRRLEIEKLIELIDDNIRAPFIFEIKDKKCLLAKFKRNKISLNQLMEEITRQNLFNKNIELCIENDKKTLYFDTDLILEKKNIQIKCDIEIMQRCTIYLRSAQFSVYSYFFEGKVKKGTQELVDNAIVLNPSSTPEKFQRINYMFL